MRRRLLLRTRPRRTEPVLVDKRPHHPVHRHERPIQHARPTRARLIRPDSVVPRRRPHTPVHRHEYDTRWDLMRRAILAPRRMYHASQVPGSANAPRTCITGEWDIETAVSGGFDIETAISGDWPTC